MYEVHARIIDWLIFKANDNYKRKKKLTIYLI